MWHGLKVCQIGFSAIVQMSKVTVKLLAVDVRGEAVAPTSRRPSGAERYSAQTVIIATYLEDMAVRHAMRNPHTRGGAKKGERTRWYFMSHDTKRHLYVSYRDHHAELVQAAVDAGAITADKGETCLKPVTFHAFLKLWTRDHSHLRVFKRGSDFCDVCTTFRNIPEPTEAEIQAFTAHFDASRLERETYRLTREVAINEKAAAPHVHLIFDFAENIKLPRPQKEWGRLFFITPLRVNLFGVHLSNSNLTFVFSLPEGHWPGDKGCDSVLSMLMHVIALPGVQAMSGHRRIHLDCDNCSGQNKNRWVVWFCNFLVITNIVDEVVLHFMVAGHTKNAADGAFGLVKRAVKTADILTPQDVHRVLATCSDSVRGVPSTAVKWTRWKEVLEHYFSGTIHLLTRMHRLTFGPGGVVLAQRLSSSKPTAYNLLKQGTDPAELKTWEARARDLRSPIKPLSEMRQGDMNRREYLQKHVINRVFAKVPGMSERYFGDGSGWEDAALRPEQVVTHRFMPTPTRVSPAAAPAHTS